MKVSTEGKYRRPRSSAHWKQEDGSGNYVELQNIKEVDDDEILDMDIEESELFPHHEPHRLVGHSWRCSTTSKILAAVNGCLIVTLVITWAVTARAGHSCVYAPEPPYSPLYEDGAVKYVNKMFRPDKMFQSEPSEEVDAAWNASMGSSDGLVKLPGSIAAKLPETVKLFFDPGYYAYGVSGFHQLHCLNRIRKSFYPDRYFPDEPQEKIIFHKNHCIDLLRQTIMCHADPSTVYWWNSEYTYIDGEGNKHYTQEYLSRNDVERAEGSFVKWEVATRCRDWNAINDWTEKNSVDRDKYLHFATDMGIE